MNDRCSKFDVTHALAANLRAGDFDATTFTDDALKTDTLVLTAVALPVLLRTENLLAEEAVLFRLKCAVVDCFWLLDLAVRPRADGIRGGKSDTKLIKSVDVKHCHDFSPSLPGGGHLLHHCHVPGVKDRYQVLRRYGRCLRRVHAFRSRRLRC